MSAILSSVKPAIKNLVHSHESLDTWIDNVTKDEALDGLTKIYVNGDAEKNVTPALSEQEQATFTRNFETQTAEPQSSIQEIGAFYAGYPFGPEPLPLSHDGFLRAVVALTGKDKALYEKSSVSHEGTERIIRKGRNDDDKVRLLFAALSGGQPTSSDVLDVLSLVQPPSDTSLLPKGHKELTVAANRLAPKATTTATTAAPATLPAAEVITFFNGIDVEPPVITGDVVDYEYFQKLLAEKPETFDALAKKAAAFLSS